MDGLHGAWNIEVESEHRTRLLHCVHIRNVVVRDRYTELKDSQLYITSSPNISVHIDLVVKRLLMLNNEALVGCVFVAL